MLDGVPALVPRVEVEALFADGMRLVVLHDPLTRSAAAAAPRRAGHLGRRARRRRSRSRTRATSSSAITSHFHVFEVNRDLRLDRAAAWGMRLAIPAGEKLAIAPGRDASRRTCARSAARGSSAATAGCATGRWTPTARSSGRSSSPASGGTAVPESGLPYEAGAHEGHVALGDTGLTVQAEVDEAGGPDELLPGWGGTMRDGLGVRAERGGVEIAITGGLVLDPVLGVRRTSIGVVGGRIAAIGRAGNPDTMDGIDVVLDSGTAVVDAAGLIVTPGVVDSHVHFLSPQVGAAALAGGVTTLMVQDPEPGLEPRVRPRVAAPDRPTPPSRTSR